MYLYPNSAIIAIANPEENQIGQALVSLKEDKKPILATT